MIMFDPFCISLKGVRRRRVPSRSPPLVLYLPCAAFLIARFVRRRRHREDWAIGGRNFNATLMIIDTTQLCFDIYIYIYFPKYFQPTQGPYQRNLLFSLEHMSYPVLYYQCELLYRSFSVDSKLTGELKSVTLITYLDS